MVAYSRKRRGAPIRRRRPAKRPRTSRMMVPRNLVRNNITFIKRKYYYGFIDILQTSWFNQSFTFRLDQLPSYSEFAVLFDQYKINAVKIDFVPGTTSNDQEGLLGNATAGASVMYTPQVYTIVDLDGNPQITTQAQTLENSNVRLVKRPFSPFSIYVKHPRLLMAAGGVSGAIPTRGWIDTTQTGAIHHGAGIAGQILSGSTNAVFRCYVTLTYYMCFRKAK